MPSPNDFVELAKRLTGSIHTDDLQRTIYSTDASVYQQMPLAVAFPANAPDIQQLVRFAKSHGVSLIPRTAGTSLAGQVVGAGIVVDVSKHLTKILEIDPTHRWVRVQPGVIRNELNLALEAHGLFFGPETSTANRAMMGGMLGNNSAGANSIVYGSTRDQTIAVKGILSDGSVAQFGPMSRQEFESKCLADGADLLSRIYMETAKLLAEPAVRQRIGDRFPKPEIHRRNTGYAIDRLIDSQAFDNAERPFNFCDLIAGSEGTLFFATEIKLRCHPLPPTEKVLACIHFHSVGEAIQATQIALRYHPHACELIDRLILEGASRNIQQQKNREFVEGDPEAILMIELRGENESELQQAVSKLVLELGQAKLGFAFPVLQGEAAENAWELRRAGLGVVNNVVGDTKPVTLIEDVAVAPADLESYIADVDNLLESKYGVRCVHYAHAGAGELHLRPLLNLKSEKGRGDFRKIASDVADLAKKYRGSLSGEHGDGRLRSEFLERMIGSENYKLVRALKKLWDPDNVFNPGKIVDAEPMDQALRVLEGRSADENAPIETMFDFSRTLGVLGATEMCSGSGDCRKTHLAGGTMCPSYMATRNEWDTTRARANLLRHALTHREPTGRPFNHEGAKEILDLCLSCKGCKSECPSNVDMARLKAEFMHGYHESNGIPFRTKMIARFFRLASWPIFGPQLFNWLTSSPLTKSLAKRVAGFHPSRSIPPLARQTMRSWYARRQRSATSPAIEIKNRGKVFLFCDEFTNYLEPQIGIAAVELLERLGWEVELVEHEESGRASLSKGLLGEARKYAERNVEIFASKVTSQTPLIGIEPSALLSFRDEYPDLVTGHLKSKAVELAQHTMLIDEFLANQVRSGAIVASQFTDEPGVIKLHGHCHQKALSSLADTETILSLPQNYSVETIRTGCCGMAGSFGMEREHYELSMRIGELVLFPAVRQAGPAETVVATGTSCRHQILDGTKRIARHPVEVLRNALRPEA